MEYTNVNPVEALLGEDGVIAKYSGELQRDWYDVYVVKRVGSDTDIEIREGKNLLGVSYDVDLTNVTTRIMPTGEDKDGELLYLPELYVDSPHISDYPIHVGCTSLYQKRRKFPMAVLSEMLRRAIEQNAHEAIDQEEYNRRYDSLNERYKGLEARAEEIAAEKRRRHYLRNNLRQFITTIDKADLISEFSPEAWTALVESVTVNAKDDMRFNFRNGMSL